MKIKVDIELYGTLEIDGDFAKLHGNRRAVDEAIKNVANISIGGDVRIPETYENEKIFGDNYDNWPPEEFYLPVKGIKLIAEGMPNKQLKDVLEKP